MKRPSFWILITLIMTIIMGSAMTVEAGNKTVDKAQKDLNSANAEKKTATEAYNKAKTAYEKKKKAGYDEGAPGFYHWIIKNYSGGENQWMAEDASQALELYQKSDFRIV